MRVAFRVDAGATIGAGHVMRCLTIADALRAQGAYVRFVTREHPGNLDQVIRARGHDVATLGAAKPHATRDAGWDLSLGTTQPEDAEETLEAVADMVELDWLVVDHYAIDALWHRVLRTASRRIMAIDDLANRSLDADLVLNPSFGLEPRLYASHLPSDAQMLLGPRYALVSSTLRKAAAHRRLRVPEERDATILVSLGGADPDDATSYVLRLAAPLLRRVRHVDVAIGHAHPAIDAVQTASASVGAELHVQSDAMADLLGRADVAVGAGGTSTWERLCVGVPSVVVMLAENQAGVIEGLTRARLVVGASRTWQTDGTLLPALEGLIDNPVERKRMARAGRMVVDGQGADRVVAAILQGA